MGLILFVCPDQVLADEVRATLGDSDDRVEVIVSSKETLESDIASIDRGITLIVSRGSLGQYIIQHLPYPVIFIKVSFAEVLMQVKELRTSGARHIAVLGSKFWIDKDLSSLTEEMVGCKFFVADSSEERRGMLGQIYELGFDSVITVETDFETARKYGLRCLPLKTSSDSIIAGYNEARFVAKVIGNEQIRSKQVRTLLDSADDAHVMISSDGVSYANHMAHLLFGKENLTENDLRPYFHMHNIPGKVGDTLVLVNATTYTVSPEEFGYIISFKDVSNIQRSELIVRKSFKQGFTAKNSFSNILSESKAMNACIETAKEYAKYDSTILITGETGTGKELFAQSIHNASGRRAEAFVSVNCASIQPNMLESELFGRAENASVGLGRPGKYGLFELAHNGTLFLDEISSLPMSLQARLLRVLQEKELLRVGDDKVIPINVRVICSTNRDLKACIAAGSFRSDLYYRINVLDLAVPSLRERRADIAPLYRYFVRMYSDKYGADIKIEDAKCLEMLEDYDWPGNVRELMNLAERSVVLCKSGIIGETMLAELMLEESPPGERRTETQKAATKRRPSKSELEKLVKLYSKKDICDIYGISRSTLWRLLNQK